jgi:tetratricopeptide (TPR) repeat protein
MALHGSLEQLRPGEVLQTIVGNRQTGLLRLRRAGQRVLLHVAPGALRLLEPPAVAEDTLVDAFRRRSLVAEEKVAQARAELPRDRSVLAHLRNQKVLTDEVLERMLSAATEDAVLDVLSWTDGDFRFDEGAEPPSPTIVTRFEIDPAGLLLRAAQRVDETAAVEAVIGRNAFLLCPGDGPRPPEDDPTSMVHAQMDGRTLLDEAAARAEIGLFAARRSAAALVEAGSLRLPSLEELSEVAKARESTGDFHAAISLALQWRGLEPLDPAPLAATARIARRAGRHEDEAEALKELARLHMERLEAASARDVYARLLEKRPGDRDAMEGVRAAARAVPDPETFAHATFQLAETAMQEGETARASVVLQELLAVAPDDVRARLLRARALVRLGDRVQAVSEIETVVGRLPAACKRRIDADVARRCREALLQVAPERSDLLRSLRTMLDAREAPRRRRVAILGALGLVMACAGWVLWPTSPRPLLKRATAAAERGDVESALQLVEELESRFPGTEEAEAATEIRNRIAREGLKKNRPEPTKDVVQGVVDAAARTKAALAGWPSAEAVAAVEELRTLLAAPDGDVLRARVPADLRTALSDAAGTLRLEAQCRRDAIDAAGAALARAPNDPERLRAAATAARRALDADWAAKAAEASRAARRLGATLADPALTDPLARAEADVEALQRAIAAGQSNAEAVEREWLRVEIQATYERCRTEVPRLLAMGKLDDAEAVYDLLAEQLAKVGTGPAWKSLRSEVEQRGIDAFVEQRRKGMRGVREGLKAAAAAEKAGDLASAASVYAALVIEHPSIGFDSVFTFPLRVESVPAGAQVEVNGTPAGAAPVLLRYGWGSQTVVTVAADGFRTSTTVVRTTEAKPSGTLRVALVPVAKWTRPLVGVVEATPIATPSGIVLCNRAGRVEMRAPESGEVAWVRDVKTIEGVRSRPAEVAGVVCVPCVDGRVARLSARNGDLLGWTDLPARTAGDAAALPPVVGVPTTRSVVLLDGATTRGEVTVEGSITAGALAAHGAFWVGTASGKVVRVDPVAKAGRHVDLSGTDPVCGLAASRHGVLVLTTRGDLVLVDPAGTRLVWTRAGITDGVGTPAEASGFVAAVDACGHVRLVRAEDGEPAGEVEAGAPAPRGLVEVGGKVAAALEDGRLWVYDPTAGIAAVDAALGAARTPSLCDCGGGLVVVPVAPGSLSLVPTLR